MSDVALIAVKVLRSIPHSPAFDMHLDRCSAHAAFYARHVPDLPPLRLAHVLGIAILPSPATDADEQISDALHCGDVAAARIQVLH